jgi:hypothetical protein
MKLQKQMETLGGLDSMHEMTICYLGKYSFRVSRSCQLDADRVILDVPLRYKFGLVTIL